MSSFKQTVSQLEALASEPRLRLIAALSGATEPVHVQALAEITGLAVAMCSHHLRILLEAGLLNRTQHGKYAIHTVNQATVVGLAATIYQLSGKAGTSAGAGTRTTTATAETPTS